MSKEYDRQLHAGTKMGEGLYNGRPLWHTDNKGLYWSGSWYHRTPQELLDECMTTIEDLLENHSELSIEGGAE